MGSAKEKKGIFYSSFSAILICSPLSLTFKNKLLPLVDCDCGKILVHHLGATLSYIKCCIHFGICYLCLLLSYLLPPYSVFTYFISYTCIMIFVIFNLNSNVCVYIYRSLVFGRNATTKYPHYVKCVHPHSLHE